MISAKVSLAIEESALDVWRYIANLYSSKSIRKLRWTRDIRYDLAELDELIYYKVRQSLLQLFY